MREAIRCTQRGHQRPSEVIRVTPDSIRGAYTFDAREEAQHAISMHSACTQHAVAHTFDA